MSPGGMSRRVAHVMVPLQHFAAYVVDVFWIMEPCFVLQVLALLRSCEHLGIQTEYMTRKLQLAEVGILTTFLNKNLIFKLK